MSRKSFGTVLVALVATLALLAPATPTQAAASIRGTWVGVLVGDAGAGGAYPVKVRIVKRDGRLVGRVNLNNGQCEGRWVPRGKKAGWHRFREVIGRGPCVSPVRVKARLEGTQLRVVWREPKTGDTATMLANRR